MDLIALLAAAPPWVRTVASVFIALWTFATILGNALRAVPEAQYVRLERAWPRAGQLARAARKFGSDVQPFLAALLGALLGRPVHEDPEQPQPRAAERGSARPGALLVVVVLALGAYLVVGCRTAREVVMRAAPGVPDPVGCVAGTQRCDGQVPQVCSASGRWWPSLPVRPDGSQRVCGACVVEDGVAGCSL